jgi:hypothetical protein
VAQEAHKAPEAQAQKAPPTFQVRSVHGDRCGKMRNPRYQDGGASQAHSHKPLASAADSPVTLQPFLSFKRNDFMDHAHWLLR